MRVNEIKNVKSNKEIVKSLRISQRSVVRKLKGII